MESQEIERTITKDTLASGDRSSLFYFAMTGSFAIQKDDMVVFMVDALGRVVLMPPSAVQVLSKPRILDDELNTFTEEQAISIMLKQGDSEETIIAHLQQRPVQELK